MGVGASLSPVERLVVDSLRRYGASTRTELATRTGLPRSTVSDALARLRRQGLVADEAVPARSADRPGGRRGRPAAAARLAAPPEVVGVIALTHGTLRAGAVRFDGTVLADQETEASLATLPDGPVGPGLALLDAALATANASRGDLACAVLGLPLPVVHPPERTAAGGRLPLRGWPVPEWAERDPAGALSAALGVPAWCENDANLAALGEHTFGAGRGRAHLIHLKVAQGIGAGIVINNALCRGARGLAGEMLHLHIADDGPVCRCGSRGCLITRFDTPRLVDIVQPAHPETLTTADVLALAAQGDLGATRALEDLGRLLGRSLADVCVYFNLEALIVDGVLGGAAAPVIAGIRHTVDRFAYPTVAADVAVLPGELGTRAELLGAVVQARQRLTELPKPIT